ncbi:MAG: S49 family peptidase [Alphaproteobacteria bacterium]|nr:S49 family peptidase [Alphaproteobacteria bacterium]
MTFVSEYLTSIRSPVVSVLRLSGVIAAGAMPLGRRGLNLATYAPAIERAFKMRHVKAVALAVNSPGGSPVQSALLHDRIRQLAEEKEIPVYAFCEDVAASGGYWIASAADEIYADENSIVGSIGVISGSFGLKGLIERFGVDRRLYTAGDKKSLLDPFLDEKPTDVERLRAVLDGLHESFKDHVRIRREGKLGGDDQTLFSGEFWLAPKAQELGLIDGIGNLRGVMRSKFGKKVKFRAVGVERGWLARRLGVGLGDGLGSSGERWLSNGEPWASDLLAAVEERLFWSRFGL